jgi:FAD/FMN-containing dehydrogenase
LTPESDSAIERPAGFRGPFRNDLAARAVYSEAAGIDRIIPRAVAIPEDADDVVTLVRWARDSGLPLTPRGSGTSMPGGAVGHGVIVDLSRMNAIGLPNVDRRSIEVGPGAIRGAINSAAVSAGLRFPIDPSSGSFCTIGGMVGTNASGARTLKFGSTRHWVISLDCVFADGSRGRLTRGSPPPDDVPAIARFLTEARPLVLDARKKIDAVHEGVRKESSGYALGAYAETGELIDLIVGSEGTLAIIVGIELSLSDMPAATSGVLGSFASLDDAVAGAAQARELGAVACELLDRTFLEIASGSESLLSAPVPVGTEAVLLAEIEGESEGAAQTAAQELAQGFWKAGAIQVSVALSPREQEEIWELRHAASPILSQLDPALASMQFIEDGAVPPDRLADYVRGVRAALESHAVRGVIFGHAGDAHVHVNPLIDVRKPDWRDTVEGLLEEVVTLTSRLSGTLSGEHGDGRLRAPLLAEMWPPEEMKLFQMVKSCFDPLGLLNPGVKMPLTGQRPINDVKYDPALYPLPDEARRALDRVARERAYATPRLSLIDGHQ